MPDAIYVYERSLHMYESYHPCTASVLNLFTLSLSLTLSPSLFLTDGAAQRPGRKKTLMSRFRKGADEPPHVHLSENVVTFDGDGGEVPLNVEQSARVTIHNRGNHKGRMTFKVSSAMHPHAYMT